MTDWFVLDRTTRNITGPMTQAAATALNDATHTINTDLGYLQDVKNELDDAAEAGTGGVDLAAIQAALDDGTLVAPGGGGSNLVHATNVADQAIALAGANAPQDVEALWAVNGPGVWQVGLWYEVKPFDDNDYVGMTMIADTDLGAGVLAFAAGPSARAFTGPGEIATGGWIRQKAGDFAPQVLTLGETRDWKLQITGWHYNDLDPSDMTAPVLGNVLIRNCRAVAVRLDV